MEEWGKISAALCWLQLYLCSRCCHPADPGVIQRGLGVTWAQHGQRSSGWAKAASWSCEARQGWCRAWEGAHWPGGITVTSWESEGEAWQGLELPRVCQVSPAPAETVPTAWIDGRACVGLGPLCTVVQGRSCGFPSGEEGMKKLQGWAGLGIRATEGIPGSVNMLLGVIFLWPVSMQNQELCGLKLEFLGQNWTVGSFAGRSPWYVMWDPSTRHINLLFWPLRNGRTLGEEG